MAKSQGSVGFRPSSRPHLFKDSKGAGDLTAAPKALDSIQQVDNQGKPYQVWSD